ncbi:MAG: selenide, water dikinase SelD [Bdellovibrionales bacterium RBG_16_40_8]|nr:MAG: selenide, water dikinase SelD [Bdellovibrionales bacterium RBG_16_40_8]
MKLPSPIRLTQTVQKGGCAAKVAALELRKILAQVRFPPSPQELMIDMGTFDDAAIYRINTDRALVQTLDFFTPIVDSPRQFGCIASANALSDVYAMGGKPATAMVILAFPLATLDNSVAVEILQGASDTIAEAGAALVGGHTIDDDTLKFGLSVTGFVHPDYVWSNAGAKAGDVLILTKPLGTGTLTAALKLGAVTESQIQDGMDSMCLLNDVSGRLPPELVPAIHAATDITGFGLAGHALNLARASGVSLRIESSSLPRFEKTMEFLSKGFLTKAHRTNGEYVKDYIRFEYEDSVLPQLVFDPQTSGGLLLAVSADRADQILSLLSRPFAFAQKIGVVVSASPEALLFS